MKHLLALFLLVGLANVVHAQAYQDPDWLDGTVPTRSWVISPTNPTGSAPADAFEPADAADVGFDEEDWIGTTDGTVNYLQEVGRERKFRILCEHSTAKILDPIIFPGVAPPTGHRHAGSGNVGWDQNSTYTTLRASPSATCTGGPLNSVIYWEPEMLKTLPSGVTVGLRPQNQTFYYINGVQGQPQLSTWLRNNIGFIGGANPNDYNDQARRNEYAAAGIVYGSPDTPQGFAGWQCYAGGNPDEAVEVVFEELKQKVGIASIPDDRLARHLKNENGEDPWGGNCTGTIAQPGSLIGNLFSPTCWDRHNLRGDGAAVGDTVHRGRGHMAYASGTADSEPGYGCPDNWAYVPQLEAKTEYFHAGFGDYGSWYLSSDRMNAEGTAADATSLDPCRAVGAWFCPGSTYHFDYIFGWKTEIAAEWQMECLGITVRGNAPVDGPAECNTSQISKFRGLAATGSLSPDINLSGGCMYIGVCSNAVPGNNERYNPITSLGTGTITIEHNH